ncbi:hypothetical protein QFC20_002782 [Naganishia adeliensis]|uniref:Uncharacterized protein n=1 Tax=Naganishia adeliensis TaxID=92952 RepID=A0ACC2WIT8_9TREE|nr:hypothetical protein QFC20_002782 [Naganishia adeliensis]
MPLSPHMIFVDDLFAAAESSGPAVTQFLDQTIAHADGSSANGQGKYSTDSESETGSVSASTSISSLGSENGLGMPAMQGIPEEREGDISTDTATAHQDPLDERAYTAIDRASRDITATMKQRIQTLPSDPGIKSSSRHSRDTTRASVDHAVQESADEWTILDAKPEDQAPNGRTAKQPLSARGVVDMYRLALSKRRTVPRKKPSWRSPSSSLIFGKAGGNNAKGNDSERPSPGFLTPLSPTLAEFKIRLKNRNGKKKAVARKSSTPGASTPAQASGNESSDESGILYSGGATPARYASSKSVSSKEHLDGR